MTPEQIRTAAEKLAPDQADYFAHLIRQNIRNWEELHQLDPAEFRTRLLRAYEARIEAEEESSSVFRAERLAFVRRLMPPLE